MAAQRFFCAAAIRRQRLIAATRPGLPPTSLKVNALQ